MTELDNRKSDRPAAPRRLLRLRRAKALTGQPHYRITVAGQNIVYCYIRKNACTAFKHFFLGLSENRSKRQDDIDALQFMYRYHLVADRDALENADHTIFVYRDPIERIASLFVNKFVARRGCADIFASFHEMTGINPDDATFADFVFEYLNQELETLDPHVLSQVAHLHDIYYTDAVYIDELHEAMTKIVGNEISDRYFKVKVNTDRKVYDDCASPAYDVPARELNEIFIKKNILPAYSSLLTTEIIDQLKIIYEWDVNMVNRLRRSDV